MLIYSEVCLIGHRCYSVKKVRLLNYSAFSSAVCYWTQMFFCEKYVHSYNSAVCWENPNVYFKIRKDGSPVRNLIHWCLPKEGFFVFPLAQVILFCFFCACAIVHSQRYIPRCRWLEAQSKYRLCNPQFVPRGPTNTGCATCISFPRGNEDSWAFSTNF